VRIDSIVFDCIDATPLARFWSAALGWSIAPYDEEELARLRKEVRELRLERDLLKKVSALFAKDQR